MWGAACSYGPVPNRVVFESEASGGGGSKAGGLPTLPFPSPPLSVPQIQ